jgi:hypothetical protein
LPQTEEEYRKTLQGERDRAAILIGFFSLVLAIRFGLNNDSFWNFPWWCGNSCPHLTLLLLPTFTNWIISWVGYLGCMFVYFSEDRLDKYSWSRPVREAFRRIGHLFVWWYPVTVIILSASAGLAFQLPESVQSAYWLTVFALLTLYLIWTAGSVGVKLLGKRSILDKPVDFFLELMVEGLQVIAETLVHTWRTILTTLRHPRTGPTSAKRAMRIFIIAIELAAISFGYFVEHLSGLDFVYVLEVPLYLLVITGVIIALFRRRKQKSTSEKEVQGPPSQ